MKVSCIFTLNELKKIVPSITIEHFKSDNPKVKEALKKLFWNLGCTLPDKRAMKLRCMPHPGQLICKYFFKGQLN